MRAWAITKNSRNTGNRLDSTYKLVKDNGSISTNSMIVLGCLFVNKVMDRMRKVMKMRAVIPISDCKSTCCALVTLICLVFSTAPLAFGATREAVVNLNNEGVRALQSNNLELAEDRLQKCLKLDPSYKKARENMAILYNHRGILLQKNPPKAIVEFHKAQFYQPGNATSSQNLRYIIKALGKDPDSFRDRLALGREARLAGDLIGATVEFGEALKIKDDTAVRLDLGNTYRVLDQLDDAIEQYKIVCSNVGLDSDTKVQSYQSLGRAYLAKKDFQNSIAAYKEAIAINSTDRETLEANRAVWEEMLRNDPTSVANHVGLGQAYAYLGDFAAARSETLQALVFDKNNEQARQLLNKIEGGHPQRVPQEASNRRNSSGASGNIGAVGTNSARTESGAITSGESEADRQKRIHEQAERIAAARLAKKQAEDAEALRLADELYAQKAKEQQNHQQTQTNAATQAQTSAATKLQPSKTASIDRPIRDKWAVVVGVSQFKDPTIPPLKYSAKDARDFYNYLISDGNFKPDHVRLLTNEKATRERIFTEIGDKFLPHVVGQDDLVVLYFATHGSGAEHDVRRSNYLVAYDTPKTLLYADGIEMQKLLDQLQDRTHADRVLIVLDACHSGGADPNARALGDNSAAMDINSVSIGRGNIILSSSQPDELSWESKRYQNGVFTKQLINSLSKDPGVLSAFEKVKDVVADEVLQTFGQHQTPRVKADGWEGKELRLNLPATKPVTVSAEVKQSIGPDSKDTDPLKAPARSTALGGH